MRDGFTRKIEAVERDEGFDTWVASNRAAVVVLSGDAAGTEWEVDKPCCSIGRGDGADWRIDDDAVSKEHANVEFVDGGFRLRDLGSMNGTRVNGSDVKAADLKSGDRFQLGNHEFQFVLETRTRAPRTYVLPDA